MAQGTYKKFIFKAAGIISVQVAATGQPTKDIRQMIGLKERGWSDPGVIKRHNLEFSDVQQAYHMYADHSDGVIKVVMSVNGRG